MGDDDGRCCEEKASSEGNASSTNSVWVSRNRKRVFPFLDAAKHSAHFGGDFKSSFLLHSHAESSPPPRIERFELT